MFVLSFLFLTVCLLCLSLSWVSYGDVEKSTHPMSAQCAAGEQIVIDLASAPTPWRWRWQWQRDWGLGERERKYIALYLQFHSNNVNTKLYFCLVYISTSSNSQSKFSISCVSPVIFPSPSCSYFFPTLPHSLCLYLPPLSPLVFLAGTVVLLSNVTSARLGQILQWSCLHLALNIGRGRKNRYTAEGSRGSDTQVESLSLCCTICRCEGSGFQPSKLCKMFVFMRDCVCIDEVCLSSVCCSSTWWTMRHCGCGLSGKKWLTRHSTPMQKCQAWSLPPARRSHNRSWQLSVSPGHTATLWNKNKKTHFNQLKCTFLF